MPINHIEVCFTPGLFDFRLIRNDFVVVVVDVLRAGTSICAAFKKGIEKIIPVGDLEEVKKYKDSGYLVAGERDGLQLDFADFGNSPNEFADVDLESKTMAYSTTNGTQAIEIARKADSLAIGTFSNLTSIAGWLSEQDKNIVILCAGWKNAFSLEDTVFAGALIEKLTSNQYYGIAGDSVFASLKLWEIAKIDLDSFLRMGSHFERLKKIGAEDDFKFALKIDSTQVVPVLKDNYLINIRK
ncbi:MAG: 2-phosphosulfolactate phosphatase [Bacteroidales bacterium]|nr:2-phosphosulfolactate phosphatase [Bacteroidales bacterium]